MIFFLIPVFNEKENIEKLSLELRNAPVDDERFYVFSDDGSNDNTQAVIETFFKDLPHIILGDGKNRGPGYAFNTGFIWILNNIRSYEDIVVTIEADCTSDLSILPEMIYLCKLKYDLVLASVYAQGGGFEKTTFFRRLISTIANFVFRFLFNIQILTLSSFYRTYKISILKRLQQRYGNEIIKESGYVSMLEILLKSIMMNSKVIEVPMELHSSKRTGKSKMKILKTTFHYLQFLLKSRNYK